MPHRPVHRHGRFAVRGALGLAALAAVAAFAAPAQAAKSSGCEGGGYQLVNLATGAVVANAQTGAVDRTIPAADLGDRFAVRGRFNEWTVRASDFAVLDYAFTGAPNPLDMTGGRRTPVFAGKVPDHRGLTLSSPVAVQLDAENLSIARTGSAASITITAKDCAAGGVFQMEPQRADGTRTRIVHTLATAADPQLTPFYYDN